MPVKFRRKVADLNKSLMVNIPKEIADELGIKKGDTIIITFENSHFCGRKEEK
ncbi:MAG: AbrB/MazE/SpoVT family DNA-binding domain-containing protein [Candidatus Heimdallarchaeota archaeon]|nr:AbrB/MazE/SpoVT family DNA-binding domain-containing protein [Candidatus Heimdallarchaeota archaeon]